jgi:hypothetical protein
MVDRMAKTIQKSIPRLIRGKLTNERLRVKPGFSMDYARYVSPSKTGSYISVLYSSSPQPSPRRGEGEEGSSKRGGP